MTNVESAIQLVIPAVEILIHVEAVKETIL
jgi:hypothetical protein